VTSVAFAPDGTLASASDDGTIRLWNPTTGTELHTLTAHTNWVFSVAFAPDGTLASAGDDGTIRLWNPTTGTELHTLTAHTNWVRSVAFAPDGTLASASDDGTIRLWNPTTGTELRRIQQIGAELLLWSDGALVAATDGAWRYLGYPVVEHGRPARLPAETYGPLPPWPSDTRAPHRDHVQ
jgi:WD40 repeat protein